MKRPLCVFCTGMMGVELLCAFLPQTELFVPFAAFFVAFCALFCIRQKTRAMALCLLAGAAAGAFSVHRTDAQLADVRARYAGRPVLITAEVEQVSASYYEGVVDAVLRVETVNGNPAAFRVECAALSACEAGEMIQGKFQLSAPEEGEKISAYADGIALQAEALEDCTVLGQSTSFRARTHRLQQRLSAALRREMSADTGSVLAAMTVGDRSQLSSGLRAAYRGAGLSHVLVVSGMHVSILCGDILSTLLPRRRERSYRSRRRNAVWKMLLSLLLVGVTGFTPSVQRAAVAVWFSALGVWLYGAPDALNALAAAGICMTLPNSYAACDIGFELSFAAVLGTLAGTECIRRAREATEEPRIVHVKNGKRIPQGPTRTPLQKELARRGWALAESICISACASAATFPVLVLRGLSVSLYAVVSSVAVLWMVQPLLLLGLGAAFTGLLPVLEPLHWAVSGAASALTGLLNAWACWIAAKPGAGIYFETNYAVVVCLLLLGLFVLALQGWVRLRVALPCILLAAAVATGVGNALSKDLVHIDLVGSVKAPSVVITQNETAVVLYRSGEQAVENQLARRGVRTVELVVDLRTSAKTACPLPAQLKWTTARLPDKTVRKQRCTAAQVEVLRAGNGTLVRLTIGSRQFVTLQGTVQLGRPLQAEWLLASAAKPDAVRWEKTLALSSAYSWMQGGEELPSSLTLRRHGGERVC